ncbi:type VI secretion system tip protein TssI/VgrG [Vreelandella stevensii]|uniref:type VI secretion system tip protein TssI/VgrG n=1 Tax=Vreelandella stevensii TaxID=502821 RepID=UPI00403B02B6
MADGTGLHFTLTLPGVEDIAVVRFTHREALSEPFVCAIEFASRHDLSPAQCLEASATLTVWQDRVPQRRIHGIVAEFAQGDRGHRRAFYHLVLRPALWRLSLRHNARIFQDTSPLDAIATLANERGLTEIAFATQRTPLAREYLVQYRETDLAFIERVAAEEGLFYFHEFENADGGAHRLVLADAATGLPSLGPRPYHHRAGGTASEPHLRRLRQISRVRPSSAMLKDVTFKHPDYAQLHTYEAPGLGEHAQWDDYEHFDYPGRYKEDASGKPFTRHRLEALRADARQALAESNLPELAPGVSFTLTDHDLDALNRDWQVVSVVHQGEQPQALEEDGMARGTAHADAPAGELMTRYHNEVVLMPKDQTFRPAPHPRLRVDGPQVATVVGPEGEEIHCDEHGRVKVQFPWDRYAEPNDTASAWIRVAQGWAGGGYGSMALPRIGHEVIISYLEGDPDQPLITGRTYHAVNLPPYPLPEHKTRTVLRTQSHKAEGFNELRFEDEAGEEQIWLHAQKDLELLTLNDRTEEIRHDSHLTVHNDRISEIHRDDHLTVHGQRHTRVNGDDHLQVEHTRHEVYGDAQLVETGREWHHSAGSQIVLEAGSEITLKAGGSFIKLDPGGVTIVGAMVKVNSGGSPGRGQGHAIVLPRLPGDAEPEDSEDVTLAPHQTPRLTGEITAATPLALDDIDITDGLADRCSACEPAVGSPVNPLLGAKLLPAETDFALPAPRPFVFSRGYLSRNARIGALGQGWSLPGESLAMTLHEEACRVHDAQGRTITFGPLAPGQARFSPTEQLWIRRGGASDDDASHAPRWQGLDDTLRRDPDRVVLSDASGVYYVFAHPADAVTRTGAPSGDSAGYHAEHHGTHWPLIEERDRHGYTTRYHWEGGLLVRVIDSAQRHYQLVYDGLLPAMPGDTGQRLTGVKLVQAHDGESTDDWLVRYSYSPAGDLIAVRHRHGEVVREFEWQDHLLTAHRVPGGMEAHYTWDRHAPDGRVVGQQEAGGLARTYTYHVDHTRVVDSLGREERYHFVGSGPGQRWTAHTRADGSRLEFRYDRAGRKIATLDPLGRETRIARDDHGQVIGQTLPDGTHWAIERDALGLPVRLDGPDDQYWQIERDARGNPLSITGPDGTTAFAYEHADLPDRPTTVTDAVGATHHQEWNALGQVTAQVDCSQQRTEYAYDRHGHLASVTNALGETTRTQHDGMGRRLATQLPDGTHWHHHHDPLGRLVEVEGPLGYRQQFFFDDHGRPVQRIEADGSQPFTAYDDAGRVRELTLGNGAVYRFSYDAMDRLTSETGPDGREQHYRYDDAGQLIERVEAHRPGPDGQPLVTRYDYDALGRLTARHLPATEHAPASTEQYQWGQHGQLLSVTNEQGEVSFRYDHAQRLVGEQQRHRAQADGAGWTWQQQHQVTANGAPQVSQFGDLPALHWHTYGSGHLHGLSAPELGLEIALEPDVLHRETQRRLHLGSDAARAPLVLERGYSPLGQLDHLTLSGAGSASVSQQYQYDALGRMNFRTRQQGRTTDIVAYTYDAAGRLIGSQHGEQAHRYSVDAAGNRLASPAQQALPDNRLTQLDDARYRYDGAGNLIERQQPDGERLTMGYDGANRLVHLTHASASGETRDATYRYDGLGRRISKTVRHPDGTTATTHYGWDGDRIVREETDQKRTTVVYEPGSFVPMLRIDDTPQGQRLSAYVTDALGTPTQLVSPSGDTRWQAQPDDWAAVKNQRGNTTQPIRFQGQWHDEESGLYYNRHRYYDPQQGRYISQDPIGLNGGTNLYGYVTNPTGMVDPLGLIGECQGNWEHIDSVTGYGESRTVRVDGSLVRLRAADARAALHVTSFHYEATLSKVDSHGNPVPGIYPIHSGTFSSFPAGGGTSKIFDSPSSSDWTVFIPNQQKSCDNCGEPQIRVQQCID